MDAFLSLSLSIYIFLPPPLSLSLLILYFSLCVSVSLVLSLSRSHPIALEILEQRCPVGVKGHEVSPLFQRKIILAYLTGIFYSAKETRPYRDEINVNRSRLLRGSHGLNPLRYVGARLLDFLLLLSSQHQYDFF